MSASQNTSSAQSSDHAEITDLSDSLIKPLDRVGFLVAGIIHNLYGPLTAMMGTVEIMKIKYPDLTEELDRLERLNERLKSDISVIMSKAHSEGVNESVDIDLAELLSTELEFYKGDPRIKHMINVTYDPPEGLPTIHAFYRNFSISIDHIITNAIEAMNDSAVRELTVSLKQDGNQLLLSVSDTGCGMDEDTLRRAFDPFFTTKSPTREGKYPPTRATGIGLTHARLLLEPLGCGIELESKPDKGTCVTIRIPLEEIN